MSLAHFLIFFFYIFFLPNSVLILISYWSWFLFCYYIISNFCLFACLDYEFLFVFHNASCFITGCYQTHHCTLYVEAELPPLAMRRSYYFSQSVVELLICHPAYPI